MSLTGTPCFCYDSCFREWLIFIQSWIARLLIKGLSLSLISGKSCLCGSPAGHCFSQSFFRCATFLCCFLWYCGRDETKLRGISCCWGFVTCFWLCGHLFFLRDLIVITCFLWICSLSFSFFSDCSKLHSRTCWGFAWKFLSFGLGWWFLF